MREDHGIKQEHEPRPLGECDPPARLLAIIPTGAIMRKAAPDPAVLLLALIADAGAANIRNRNTRRAYNPNAPPARNTQSSAWRGPHGSRTRFPPGLARGAAG
jgi:hypothetical protein